MPGLRSDLEIRSRKLHAPTVDDVIKAEIVFEGISPHDVVVVFVLQPEDQARSLIHTAGNCLKLHAQHKVSVARILDDGEGETIVGRIFCCLGEHLRWRGCRRVARYHPLTDSAPPR